MVTVPIRCPTSNYKILDTPPVTVSHASGTMFNETLEKAFLSPFFPLESLLLNLTVLPTLKKTQTEWFLRRYISSHLVSRNNFKIEPTHPRNDFLWITGFETLLFESSSTHVVSKSQKFSTPTLSVKNIRTKSRSIIPPYPFTVLLPAYNFGSGRILPYHILFHSLVSLIGRTECPGKKVNSIFFFLSYSISQTTWFFFSIEFLSFWKCIHFIYDIDIQFIHRPRT